MKKILILICLLTAAFASAAYSMVPADAAPVKGGIISKSVKDLNKNIRPDLLNLVNDKENNYLIEFFKAIYHGEDPKEGKVYGKGEVIKVLQLPKTQSEFEAKIYSEIVRLARDYKNNYGMIIYKLKK